MLDAASTQSGGGEVTKGLHSVCKYVHMRECGAEVGLLSWWKVTPWTGGDCKVVGQVYGYVCMHCGVFSLALGENWNGGGRNCFEVGLGLLYHCLFWV